MIKNLLLMPVYLTIGFISIVMAAFVGVYECVRLIF